MRATGAVLVLLLAAGCGGVDAVAAPGARSKGLAPLARARYVMGTLFEITVRTADPERAKAAIEAAFAAIRRSDETLSHWRTDNALAAFNRAPVGEPVAAPEELYQLLALADRYRRISHGAFDIAVAPLVELWRRCAEEGRLPREAEIRAARAVTGGGCVELLDDGRVRRLRAGCAVQFGAIGKGWAIDRAAEVLRQYGIRHAFISAGSSSIFAMGDGGEGAGWIVAIRDPRHPGAVLGEFRLRDGAVSTSAVGERSFKIAGRYYPHILDPRTGRPAVGVSSITVVAPTGAEADALSTAAFVLGVPEGLVLLNELQRDAWLLDAEGRMHIVRTGSGPVLRWEDS